MLNMKIEIESDVFDIVDRIKEIDDGYMIMYDTKLCRLELHNKKQLNTFCFVVKNNEINSNLINQILCSNIANIDSIVEEIDNNNILIEKVNAEKLKDYTGFVSKEIFDFASNSSKEFKTSDVFRFSWR